MQRACALLVAAGLVFASCGGPTIGPGPTSVGSSPSAAPSSTATPPAATSAPTASSPVPVAHEPTTLVDNLFDRIDAGEWSLEEGLTSTLEYLNGERELDAVVPSGETVDFESTGILGAARAYLAAAPEQPGSARVRELYDALVPTPAQLRSLAAGTGSVAARAGGGFTIAGTTVGCSDLWRGVRGGPGPGVRCLQLDEFDLPGGGSGRVYTPVERLAAPAAERYVRLATEGLRDSWSEFLGLGAMPTELDVVFDPRGSGTTGAAAALTETRTCLVIVYPLWLAERDEDAKFFLAHEAFHCFVDFLAGDDWIEGRPWWTEGSPEYFANVVYPDVNSEYVFLDVLRRREPNRSLLRLSYDAFPFFQHLGNTIGNDQVVALLRHLTAGSPPESFPDMPALFHAYAEDFLTDRIIDTSGAPIPINARAHNNGRHRPASVGPIDELRPGTFAIERLVIDWQEDREFDLEVVQVGDLKVSAQPYPDGAWQPLPDPVRTCDAGLTNRVLVTRVEAVGDASLRLHVTGLEEVRECVVQITVHGAIEAVFSGGVCYVDDGFLHVTAGFGLSDSEVEQIGPYPRGYGFILGTATPGSEEPGRPDVTIADNEHDFTDLGSNASLVKSADLLSGTFSSDDIYGDYSCPFLTPPEDLPGRAP